MQGFSWDVKKHRRGFCGQTDEETRTSIRFSEAHKFIEGQVKYYETSEC
jgi:hypothetical protein